MPKDIRSLTRRLAIILLCLAAAMMSARDTVAAAPPTAQPPTMVCPANNAWFVALPDGAIQMLFARPAAGGGVELAGKVTPDNGRTWSEPATVMKLPADHWSTPLALLAQDGELHLFWMVDRGRRRKAGHRVPDRHLALALVRWSHPVAGTAVHLEGLCRFDQRNGPTPQRPDRGAVRVLARRCAGGAPTGPNVTTTIYSDDHGQTWKESSAKLTAPCYEGYNGANYGACEPTIMELKDGRVWMIIRTQTGWLYESFSNDGVAWSEAKPTRFCSSDSPAALVRLSDGRIALFWNNCENTSRINGQGVYTNRDALHGAISDDEGRDLARLPRDLPRPAPQRITSQTRRPRNVLSLPRRDQGRQGPRGHRSGFGAAARPARRSGVVVRNTRRDDFSAGLDGWCVFKAFGPRQYWWRDRVQGARLIDHPAKAGAKVLQVRRPDDKDGDGAVWNFPAGRQGTLTVRLLIQQGFGGGSVALADRFIQPNDDVGEKKVLVTLPIRADGELPGGTKLEPGQWQTVKLRWDIGKAECEVTVDGKPACTLPMSKETTAGPSYVRFRSTAETVDTAGLLVESVEAAVR